MLTRDVNRNFIALFALGIIIILCAFELFYVAAQGEDAGPPAPGPWRCEPAAHWDERHQVCLLTCWAGMASGGPAITWVPPSVCGQETP